MFLYENLQGVDTPYDDDVVISTTIAIFNIKRILVDSGSFSDILFYDAFSHMLLSINCLRKINIPLYRFSSNSVIVEGEIVLPTMLGQPPKWAMAFLKYLVAQVPSAYNALLERSGLKTFKIVASTCHLLVCSSTKFGVGEV